MPAESLHETLAIYADVVRRPHLPADQFDDARLVCLQEIRALEDDLPQRVFQELRLLVYGEPLGRSSQGTDESVEQIEPAGRAAVLCRHCIGRTERSSAWPASSIGRGSATTWPACWPTGQPQACRRLAETPSADGLPAPAARLQPDAHRRRLSQRAVPRIPTTSRPAAPSAS